MEDVVIVAAARTAVGKFGASLAKVSAAELGATVIRGLLAKTGVAADQIDEAILGQVLRAIPQVAERLGIRASGFRLINNCGRDAGQTIDHVHFHLLAVCIRYHPK